ncbi:Cof-type HAD-IIB family hydrolase [Hespellia stercorisuis]|uniref:Haloacid dehalogenase-like hydrolase n=1 Tax=Hespellia stercorisuis DSM 15480 TaxID=1121950 RepID=A0A1M6JJX4_9FIRM|nr:Cof-type HAD-IIB family hydrolase [Hespellia stercorisuis]SHJ46973.1 hypothetical protein SAMN02745243_00672 [Hespellia stercorisuis DSM 15480]
MKRKIKMIGMDLDGTLLTTKKELLPYTREILRKAIDQGVVVLAATGRALSGVPQELLEFPGMRYVVTANGARIIDQQSENMILYEKLLPLEKANQLLDVFRKYDTLLEVYFDGRGYVSREHLNKLSHYVPDPYMVNYISRTRTSVDDLEALIQEKQAPMDKVQALFYDLKERQTVLDEIEQWNDVSVAHALAMNIEVNAGGVNKGSAMLRLGEMLGIRREEIMACGDGNNDLDMLKTVGFAVAMKNAESSVKAAADYITGTNDEQGVAKAIEHFVLR